MPYRPTPTLRARGRGRPWVPLELLESRCFFTVVSGAELLVNTETSDDQQTDSPGAVSADAAGNFVVAWESDDQDYSTSWGIYAQRFAADGTTQGGEFLVNATLLNNQRAPTVSMNASGQFVIAWHGRGLLSLLFPGIYAQRYDADGTPVGTEIAVAGSAILSVTNAVVGVAPDGSFVVAWDEAGTSRDLKARMYDADGDPLGAEFIVSQTTSGSQNEPQIAVDDLGRFVIVWAGEGSGDSSGVFARLFDADGTPLTGEILVNESTSGTQSSAAVAFDPDGGFAVAWAGNGSGDSSGVFVRAFDADGSPLTGAILVNQTTAGTQARPAVAFDADGDFLVAWSGNGSGDSSGIFAREFWNDASAKGSEFLVNSTTSGTQSNASVAPRGDNAYVVSWSGNGTGDSSGTFARLLVNDAPAVATSSGSASFTEGDTPVAVDPGLTLSDADHADLAWATVRISANFDPARDALLFADTASISASWDALSGTLTLSGAASLADWQAALRAVAFVTTGDDPSPLARSVEFVVSDGLDASSPASRDVSVSPVNDAPAVATSSGSASFTEGDTPVAVDPGLTLSDADHADLAWATVRISANFDPARDALLFADTASISASWDALSGTLTLSGAASLADWQAALRAVAFVTTGDDPSPLARSVEFVVSDGLDASSPASRDVSVSPVNDAPAVATSSGSAAFTEGDTPVAVDPGLTLSDADHADLAWATVRISANFDPARDALLFTDTASITASWDALSGTLTLTGAASLADWQAALRAVAFVTTGDDPSPLARSVEFVVSDGLDASSPASRDVEVSAVEEDSPPDEPPPEEPPPEDPPPAGDDETDVPPPDDDEAPPPAGDGRAEPPTDGGDAPADPGDDAGVPPGDGEDDAGAAPPPTLPPPVPPPASPPAAPPADPAPEPGGSVTDGPTGDFTAPSESESPVAGSGSSDSTPPADEPPPDGGAAPSTTDDAGTPGWTPDPFAPFTVAPAADAATADDRASGGTEQGGRIALRAAGESRRAAGHVERSRGAEEGGSVPALPEAMPAEPHAGAPDQDPGRAVEPGRATGAAPRGATAGIPVAVPAPPTDDTPQYTVASADADPDGAARLERERLEAGSLAAAATFAVALGAHAWHTGRARMLHAHLMSMLPLWRWLDPVPVLDSWSRGAHRANGAREGEDERRLRSMLRARGAQSEGGAPAPGSGDA